MRPARWPAAALGASSVLYSSWLLGPWLNPRLGLTTGLASDLAAADQPWHEVFRYCDVAAGSLALLGSARMLVGGRGDRRLRWHRLRAAERTAWVFVAVFALATIFDGGLTALPCAPSIDPGCPGNLSGGLLETLRDPHTLTSAFAVIGGVGSILAFWRSSRAGSTDRTWAAGLSVGSLAVNVGLLVELARNGDHEGIWQRVELANLAAWLVYAAVRSQQPPRRPA
ncbi:uncharacterized protein DUF998 [Asanoa ferruginea]|uniref:Uncharacterized protein DUF998 n=1 Tax=Asanoa ferruginea TaxID=53367 RepID=A0A3D9ZJ35_9ACTN|nr:DUF998 domain-containing protein [Asanoa ferruginea]REF97285.1 uncharacterized protein DUF998 [Asanoa ferruginea]GIF49066.1 hypothetical protein Afe04nite_36050 [Asanoa ferruginea]